MINLEACGVGGPEIVFQATSEEVGVFCFFPFPPTFFFSGDGEEDEGEGGARRGGKTGAGKKKEAADVPDIDTQMIRALSKTPRPYGTVLASEIFSTGLILSE